MHRSVHKHYVVPVSVVHAGITALLASILLNTAGTLIHGWPTFTDGLRGLTTSTGLPSRLPIVSPPVAMEVIDSERYGMHDDNDWASVIPNGHGFVRLGEGESGAYYAVSMYHQMHCLNSFRKMFNGRNESRADHDGAHALHCLTYLRQMVLCSADITLEPAFSTSNVDGRKTQAAYGTGVAHVCRDWVQAREWVEDNYKSWIDEDRVFVATEASAVNG
ncbi:hypothetical protein WOLCODRAFT_110565 [Wolfiporia cocos MD-104 SS10]|uniref:Oxidase ustYa n=1 Tax=Wolfiporia cocos (strain MD-104) TaxID=742152 RepID=A0A2H3JA89_WOLCO|nr:hypothetical protein WOLCODRAFT_110565 [Wolfiporia cocos MD-104 SS10]